ncbi:MAG: hypothetical protein ACHQ50_12305 [Fimbriimonadales bacterium]
MTHCNWCGLVSEDDKVCSWCKKPLVEVSPASPPDQSQPERSKKPIGLGIVILLLVALVCMLGIWKHASAVGRPPQEPSAGSQSSEHASHGLSGVPIPPPSAQIGSSAPADGPATETSKSDSTPSADSNADASQATAQDPVTSDTQLGSVHLADASLAIRDDDSGQEWAAGKVVIVNDGPYAITDFRLTLRVGGANYTLTPFNGSPDNPLPMQNRELEPGQRLEVPVLTNSPYPAGPNTLVKTITVRATIDGPPGTVTDSVQVP